MEFSEGEKSDKGMGSLFKEIMIENFSNVGRDLGIQDHEASRSLHNSNSKWCYLRYIKIKLSKNQRQRKILKETKEKDSWHINHFGKQYDVSFKN